MQHELHQHKNLLQKIASGFLCCLFFSGCLNTSSESLDSGSGADSLSDCSLNVVITTPCKLATTGAIASTVQGSNITTYSNVSASTSITAPVPNGFYSGKTVTFTDAFLLPANIKSGITIFGVLGTGASFFSNANRDKASLQLSVSSETSTYAGIALPSAGGYIYRDIPKISKDDDGTTGGSVTYVNRTTWNVSTCGTTGTLAQRIANCAGTLGATATWTGATSANGGQSTWKIVTRSGACNASAPNRECSEVWRDESTQLLWSSKISEAINWCQSSGNNFIAANPASEDDPNNFCDVFSYQAIVGQAISACHEDGSVNFTDVDASITNSAGKAGLGNSSTPAVAWRLPTKGDYEQANTNGLRYVMPDSGSNITAATSTYEWTATVLSTSRDKAWIFDSYLGYLATNSRELTTYNATNVGVRCVGR